MKYPRILILGVCASGKSTLCFGLKELGYDAHTFAQEHSQSPRTWQRRRLDCLIVLDITYDTFVRRRGPRRNPDFLRTQRERLSDAFAKADLVIRTDHVSPEAVLNLVLTYVDNYIANTGEADFSM